jgi:hypothetical protein
MSDDSNAAPNERAVLGFCEVVALMFGLPPGEALYRGDPIDLRMVGFMVLGATFASLGPAWPIMRRKFPEQRLILSLGRIASDFRYWLAVLFAIFFYGTGSSISQMATAPWVWRVWSFIGVIGMIISVALVTTVAIKFRRNTKSHIDRTTSSDLPNVLTIHTCIIGAQADNVNNDLYLDIYVAVYNGENVDILLNSVSGAINYNNINSDFPTPPNIIGVASPINIKAKSEVTFALRQHMHRATADQLHNGLFDGGAIILTFHSLTILVAKNDQPSITSRLPMWDGIRLSRSTAVGRVVSLSARVRL